MGSGGSANTEPPVALVIQVDGALKVPLEHLISYPGLLLHFPFLAADRAFPDCVIALFGTTARWLKEYVVAFHTVFRSR